MLIEKEEILKMLELKKTTLEEIISVATQNPKDFITMLDVINLIIHEVNKISKKNKAKGN